MHSAFSLGEIFPNSPVVIAFSNLNLMFLPQIIVFRINMRQACPALLGLSILLKIFFLFNIYKSV